jgi:hypothetical protein
MHMKHAREETSIEPTLGHALTSPMTEVISSTDVNIDSFHDGLYTVTFQSFECYLLTLRIIDCAIALNKGFSTIDCRN